MAPIVSTVDTLCIEQTSPLWDVNECTFISQPFTKGRTIHDLGGGLWQRIQKKIDREISSEVGKMYNMYNA